MLLLHEMTYDQLGNEATETDPTGGVTTYLYDPAGEQLSVTDPTGRLHQFDNLVVADSSVFVTSTGYGPTLTLAALAARAAHLML